MRGLWKIRSGKFAGWRVGDDLFDPQGYSVGYFLDFVAYSNRGRYIGDLYRGEWIGRRAGVERDAASPRRGLAKLAWTPHARRPGLGIEGWQDPDF